MALPAQPSPVPAEVWRVLDHFRTELQQALGDNLLALYVDGSLTKGDFEPSTSDVDFLAVLQSPLHPHDSVRLAAMHRNLAVASLWGGRLEGEYAAREQLRPWGIAGAATAIEAGGELGTPDESDCTAENIAAMRDYGRALVGPPAVEVLPVVDTAVLETALRDYANDLVTRTVDASSPSVQLMASWVLNLARCRYGLRVLRTCTKREAAEWLMTDSPALAPALTTALAVRRGESPPDAFERLQSGLRILQAWFASIDDLDHSERA